MTTSNPEKVGRYQIVERVGKGGMGVLYRGIDPVLDREVAIKLMLLDFSEDEEQLRARFYREARAIAKLQHRNIVTVFEFAEENTTPYIVMEFLQGTSLADRMKSPLPLSLDDKLNIMTQLCEAMHYAHVQGVVHRDIKPANVFLLPDGSVKLLDFGIAKVATSTLTRTREMLGSISYMSPEQVAGSGTIDGRSDIFSSGVLMYELLTGRKPFDSDAPTATILKILNEPPAPVTSFIAGLPAQLVAAGDRALAKKPEDRFGTAGEFGRELESIRRALRAAGEGAGILEETRFASPTELVAMQDAAASALSGSAASSSGAATSTGSVAADGGKGTRQWLIPAGVAAVILVGAIILASTFGRGKPSPAVVDAPAAGPSAAGATAAGASAPATGAAVPAPVGAATPKGASATPAAGSKPSAAAPASVDRTMVRIESTPSGAAIFLDGRNTKQTTPASLPVTGAESHQLRLTKRGFADHEVALADADVRRGPLTYTLQPETATMVPVVITSTYPVEVFNGSTSISSAGESHQLNISSGSTVSVRAPQYLLNATFKVEGKPIEYQAPALGYLTVLTKYETCNVKIGSRDLGFPPITRLPLVVGQYRVDIACATGQNPPGQLVTVAANTSATARIY